MSCFIVCIRVHDQARRGNSWVEWASPEELLEADRVLLDRLCGDGCAGVHVLSWHDGIHCYVRRSMHDPLCPPSLSEELAALYHYRPEEFPVELWPVPADMNEALEKPVGTCGLGERVRNGERVALIQQLAETAADVPL